MKNREEYLASIYAKRDKELIKQKKRISVISSVACLGICFIAIFSFIPKKLGQKSSLAEITTSVYDKFCYSQIIEDENNTENITDNRNTLFTFTETYEFAVQAVSEVISENNNRNEELKDGNVILATTQKAIDKNEQETEVEIVQGTTKRSFGGFFGGASPLKPLGGSIAETQENPTEDNVTGVTEPYSESPDGTDDKTTKADLRSSDEAVEEALKYIPEEDAKEIDESKTQVTISRTSSGKSTYTVYFYTEKKTFTIELNAVTLEMIECKEKDKNTGNVNYYSPAHFPETTAALPEYKPQ